MIIPDYIDRDTLMELIADAAAAPIDLLSTHDKNAILKYLTSVLECIELESKEINMEDILLKEGENNA